MFLPPSYSHVADDTRIQVVAENVFTIFVLHSRDYRQHIQRAWDAPIVNSVLSTITASAVADVDNTILKEASAPHSGDWLHTSSIASLGLKLTDDEIRISVALRLGIRACTPHNCLRKAYRCQRSSWPFAQKKHPKRQRHPMLNDII